MNKKIVKYIVIFLLSLAAISVYLIKKNYSFNDGGDIIYSEVEYSEILDNLKMDPYNTQWNVFLCKYYTENDQWDSLISHCKPLFEEILGNKDKEDLLIKLGVYMSQAYVFTERFDSIPYYINSIKPYIDGKHSDNFSRSVINNISGLYVLKTELNYSKAIEHYKNAYEEIEKNGSAHNKSIILCNIASIYYSREDTSGFEYAKKAYLMNEKNETGTRLYSKTLSAILLAQMYYLKEDYKNAMYYADKANISIGNFPLFASSLSVLYANLWHKLGDTLKAEANFSAALEHISESEPSTQTFIYLEYGKMLKSAGRESEAFEVINQGYTLSVEVGSMEHRHNMLSELAELALLLGEKDKAIEYYKELNFVQNQYLSQNEKAFQQYLLLQKQYEIQEKELKILRLHQSTVFIVIITLIVISVAITIALMYRKQKKVYRKLVITHQQYISKVKFIKETHEKEVIDRTSKKSSENSNLTEKDSELQLWGKVKHLIEVQKIFCLSEVSLDHIAQELATNRTYISKVINIYSGMTFYNYINSQRIEEAISYLSSSDIPLKDLYTKVGYNSLSAFYRAFQKETGLPPSKYRAELLGLSKEKQL